MSLSSKARRVLERIFAEAYSSPEGVEVADELEGKLDAAGGSIEGTLICEKDNASSFRLRGPQAPSEGGDPVQSYAGMFYNDAYATVGTLKTRVINGANIEMDMEIQSPHALLLTAVDDSQSDGVLKGRSKTFVELSARCDAEVLAPKRVIVDRVSSATTGAANTSDAAINTNAGHLHLQAGVTFGAVVMPVMSEAQRDALSLEAGLVVFNTDAGKLQVYNGSAWSDLG